MKQIKFILPLSDIPDGSTVTKITGSKPYRVASQISIYDNDRNKLNGKRVINAESGTKFLIPYEGDDMSAYRSDREFVWEVGLSQAHNFIDGLWDEYQG